MYSDIFSNITGETDVTEHHINLTDSNPVRAKTYPVPYSLSEEVKKELSEMVELGIVEASDSPYSSPLQMVNKEDGTNRPVVDYRGPNRITVFDAEPTPNADDIFAKLPEASYFSKMDFCKGIGKYPWRRPNARRRRSQLISDCISSSVCRLAFKTLEPRTEG